MNTLLPAGHHYFSTCSQTFIALCLCHWWYDIQCSVSCCFKGSGEVSWGSGRVSKFLKKAPKLPVQPYKVPIDWMHILAFQIQCVLLKILLISSDMWNFWSAGQRNFFRFSLRPLILSMIITMTHWDHLGGILGTSSVSSFFFFFFFWWVFP